MNRPIETKILFRNDSTTPLGRLTLAGFIKNSAGVRGPTMRVLGSYALVYLLEGSGTYCDARGCSARVQAGDLLLIFPDIGHTYGPEAGEHWNEIYCVFDGPVFDVWRHVGLLDQSRPVMRLTPVPIWLEKLESVLPARPGVTMAERTVEISRFLATFTEMLVHGATDAADTTQPSWIRRACTLLEMNLHEECSLAEVASALDMPYETFRKRFRQHVGVSPGRYRAIRRVDAACAMLQHSDMTILMIATQLGFGDEFHFSKRFKQITGVSPREFRRRLPETRPV
jgi:AraC-like DNA-binding protein